MSKSQENPRRRALANVGVMVTKTFCETVPGGCKREVHFRYAASLLRRADAKQYASVFILEEYNVADVAFFANPDTIDNAFYAVFFTNWR